MVKVNLLHSTRAEEPRLSGGGRAWVAQKGRIAVPREGVAIKKWKKY